MKPTPHKSACLTGAVAALVLGACSSHLARPMPPPLPDTYSGHPAPMAIPLDTTWYRGFGSPELDRLLADGANGNLDLAVATARVQQAMARAGGARAALLPTVDAGAAANRYAGRSGGTSASETDWSALLSASYELDFWGRNRSAARSASALAQASVAERTTVVLTTQGAIASGYFSLLAQRERVALAQEDLTTARALLATVDARHDAGAAGLGEVAAQRALVAGAESAVADLGAQEASALATLAVLTGHDPVGYSIEAHDLAAIAEPTVSAGLPADLLRRRPDLLSAEATLVSASADVDAARAAFLPTIALTASGGVQSPAMQAAVATLAGTGSTLTLGASVLEAVFDGGRRRAVREEALAREQEMLAAYRAAIRNALLDVETVLAGRQALDQQRAARGSALEQAGVALNAARARYEAGAGDYLALLDAQRTLHTVRDADAQYRLARLQSCVTLFKAIGGGWQQPVPARAATSTDATP